MESIEKFFNIIEEYPIQTAYIVTTRPNFVSNQKSWEDEVYACWNGEDMMRYLVLGITSGETFDSPREYVPLINLESNKIYSIQMTSNIEEHHMFIITDDNFAYTYSTYGGSWTKYIQKISLIEVNKILMDLSDSTSTTKFDSFLSFTGIDPNSITHHSESEYRLVPSYMIEAEIYQGLDFHAIKQRLIKTIIDYINIFNLSDKEIISIGLNPKQVSEHIEDIEEMNNLKNSLIK
jgi:hypothetical protein